jgi:K+-transporting ATPase ATPase C chain
LYPLATTVVAQVVFPHQANGSLVRQNDRVMGSELIGQPFSDSRFFWGRPSATGPMPYNASASSGSNLAPTNPALVIAVGERVAALRAADPGLTGLVPIHLVTASGSGLDPHISLPAAFIQVPRVAKARHLDEAQVRALVERHSEGRQFGLLGEPRINVLALNRAVETLATNR